MKIYLGVGGHPAVHKFAEEHDCGWLMTPFNKRNPPTGGGYILDNGKFAVFLDEIEANKKNPRKNFKPRKWTGEMFMSLLDQFPNYDFAVVPDIVIPPNPQDSIDLSMQFVHQIKRPRYLVVQDRMDVQMVEKVLEHFDGIFIGGSIRWKHQTTEMWATVAHANGIRCHVGRCGTYDAMAGAHLDGADSIDTTSASRHQDDYHIRRYKEELKIQTILVEENRQGWQPTARGMRRRNSA